jgi:L-seryl-tRNA(Ser) seleniumtransferase
LTMLIAPVERIRERARVAAQRIASAEVIESQATVGGGAFPTARIPSAALAIAGDAGTVEHRLRTGDPAVIGRIANGRCVLDLRSVPESDDAAFIETVARALASR